MTIAKGTHKFKLVKNILEVIYGLTWVAALFVVVFTFYTQPMQTAAITSAAVIGGTIVFTTILILTISTVDTRNLLADIYALNAAGVDADEKGI